MQQALNLSIFKLREDIVYENARITTFACDQLIQERTKKLYPGRNVNKDFLDMKKVASMIKHWSAGESRPVNGTYFTFENMGKNGAYVMPRFYN